MDAGGFVAVAASTLAVMLLRRRGAAGPSASADGAPRAAPASPRGAATPEASPKSMQLYNNVDRVTRELREAGHADDERVSVEEIAKYDMLHYLGEEPLLAFVRDAKLGAASNVLDIGSGFGGPARFVAWKSGCAVTALELQEDLDAVGRALTARAAEAVRVTHRAGDVLTEAPRPVHDAILSILCFLHIPDKDALFAACAGQLKRGGYMFIEDFYDRGLTAADKGLLEGQVFCTGLPALPLYVEQLSE